MGGTDIASPRFTGQYYINGVLYQDGMPVVWIGNIAGGGRNLSSTTNNWDAVHEECQYSFVAPADTNEHVISAAPCFVYGFAGNTGTGTLSLRDSATVSGSQVIIGPVTLALPTMSVPAFWLPAAVRFETGLTYQLGTGTDKCVIFWRPLV